MKQSLAKFLSLPVNFKFICDAPNETTRRKRLAELKQKFHGASFALSAVEDDGATDGIYPDDHFLAPERTEAALIDIKRHLIRADIAISTGDFVRRQNAIRKRNLERKAEAQKAFSNRQ